MSERPPASTAKSSAPLVDTALMARLQRAAALITSGQAIVARAELSRMVETHPRQPEIHQLLGRACERSNDLGAAEHALRAAISLSKRNPAFHNDLGLLLIKLGRTYEAEKALQAALALDRRYDPAATALAELLNRRLSYKEALQVTLPLANLRGPSEALLSAHADALRGLGRHMERLKTCERTAEMFPNSGVAEHNLASALVDLGRFKDGERAASRAGAKGLDVAETRAVLARAHQGQGHYNAAEVAYGAALDLNPKLADVHRDLAQLIWMRTGDARLAAERIDAALVRDSSDVGLALVKAQVLESAGDAAGAYRTLATSDHMGSAAVQIAAARAALRLDPAQALAHARCAVSLTPDDVTAKTALCEGLLATGDAENTSVILAELRRAHPQDQHLLAYQATAWRLLGDPRYRSLYDYEQLVSASVISTPPGWTSLSAFISDLASSLFARHTLHNHPFGQSLRLGSQTGEDLTRAGDRVIGAFFNAVDAPIRRYIAALGAGKDPLRERNEGGYDIAGAWSVRLRPGGGHHVDHVHQRGWISSAFYVDLPPAVAAGGREGWIRFGEPGIPTRPALKTEYAIKPQCGLLVLFPSYMWHGTLPFGGERPRLSIAFDITPDRRRR